METPSLSCPDVWENVQKYLSKASLLHRNWKLQVYKGTENLGVSHYEMEGLNKKDLEMGPQREGLKAGKQ